MATQKTELVITARDQASAVIGQVNSSLGLLSRSLGGLPALASGLSVGAIVGGLRSVIGVLDDLDEASQSLGVTAVALAELRLAASESGVGTEKLDVAITRLNVKLADAAGGGKESAAVFKALGLEVKDSGGNLKSTETILGEVANKFQGYRDGAEKSALAVALFGKAGAAMIPFLNQGSDGLRKFAGVTEESVLAARKLQGEFDRLSANLQRFKQSLAGDVIPALNDLIEVAGKIDFSRALSRGNPAGVLANLVGQTAAVANKQRQLNEALALGAGAYSNEGRALQTIAPIVDKDIEQKVKKTKVLRQLAEAQHTYQEQIDRELRNERERQGVEEKSAFAEGAKAINKELERLGQLIGSAQTDLFLKDIELLNQAFFDGAIGAQKYDEAIARLTGQTSEVKKDTEKTNDLAKDLGLTFSSAFEDAIVQGKGLRDVLKGIYEDLVRILTRQLVTQPLANAVGGLITGVVGGAAGGAGAGGGQNLAGAFSNTGGAGKSSAGSIIVNQNITVDARADRASIVAAMRETQAATIAAIRGEQQRNGAFARA